MDKISWVVCTYNRTELTDEFMEHNLSNMGVEERPELIWIDNGSTDGVERLWEKYKPDFKDSIFRVIIRISYKSIII